MRVGRYVLGLCTLFVGTIIIGNALMQTRTQDEATKVIVSPTSQTVMKGQNFTVNISVVPGTEIAGMQFSLGFNSSLLKAKSVSEGDLFKQGGHITVFNPGTIDNEEGIISEVWGIIIGRGSVSTPGTFAIINMTASNSKTGISHISLFRVKVTDPEGKSVPITIENGTVEVHSEHEICFDTGPGGYPSIMGTHFGNFTPFHNITVNRIYTYAIPGTGGHSEHVIFYENGRKIAEGNWSGYIHNDYHYIVFPAPFLLEANKTYSYEIKTGSYPQIIHNKTLKNACGEVICDKFVDANGIVHDDWIPAFRLEYHDD